jgi:hypothetical protein
LSEKSNIDNMIELVELNVGSWKPLAVAVIDINYKIWGEKGKLSKDELKYYETFNLSGMHVGDSINNKCSFLMKVTDKTGVIVVMGDPNICELSAINLKGRINALSDFYTIENQIKEKQKKSILERILKKE